MTGNADQAQLSIAFQTDKAMNAYGPLAQAAEGYGFAGITVYNDMLYQPSWLPLLEVARHTTRVRIGPAAVNPFTCHPINMAANIALIDEASQGRAYLGFARGAWLDFVGLRPARPVTAVREAMACVRHLLCRDMDPLPGQVFSLAGGDTFRWPNIRPDIPFLLGSWGPRLIAACLPYVQEIKLGGTANAGAVRWLRTQLKDADVGIVVGSVTVVAEDGKAARALARREVALYLPVVAGLDPSLALEPDRLSGIQAAASRYDYDTAAGLIPDDILRQVALAGTPAEVAEQVLELFQAGARRVEFGTPHGQTAAEGLRLLGEQVLPRIEQGF